MKEGKQRCISSLFAYAHATTLKIPPLLSSFYSFQPHDNKYHDIIGSPSRVQKLIASQSDPFLAKEIFDLATAQPHFRHSYSSFFTLILKLGRSRHFSLVDDLLLRLKSQTHHYSPSRSLFTHVIKIYGESHLPHKALTTFYTMFQF